MSTETLLEPHEIQFPHLGWKFSIDPTAFSLFGFDIQWYGIIITIGLILALIYVLPRMKRFGLDSDRAVDAIIGGVIGGIIGARIYYVLMRWDEYKGDWKSIINTRQACTRDCFVHYVKSGYATLQGHDIISHLRLCDHHVLSHDTPIRDRIPVAWEHIAVEMVELPCRHVHPLDVLLTVHVCCSPKWILPLCTGRGQPY